MKRNGKKFFMPYSTPIVHVQELSFIFIFYFIHTLATKRRNEEKAHTHIENYHYGIWSMISSQMYAPIIIFHDYLLFYSNCH